ncbi:MAG TPA: glycosyltransferase [Methylomirabilota bacterium]|jgi:glycosyltransferase involved in cell wall biosynthesis
MRVLHFAPSFSPLSQTFIYDYVMRLEQQGVDNYFATLRRANESQRPFPRVSVVPAPRRWHPVRVWHRGLAEVGIGSRIPSSWPLLRSRLERLVQQIRPDVVHAHFGQAGALIAPAAKRLGAPLLVSFLGFDVSVLGRKTLWRRIYKRDLIESGTIVIGISNHICAWLSELGFPPDTIHLLHLGVRLDRFPYSNPVERWDGRTVRFLHVGRLVEKKNPVLLTQAFRHALDMVGSSVNLRLDVIGEGPLEGALRSEISRLGLEKSVVLRGSLPHHLVAEAMQEAHVYTQHSVTAPNGDQEGQGVSLVEASSCGLPVVTTRHNGFPDVVLDGETGYLVDEGDVRGMGERIAWLATHPERWREMGARGRKHVESHMNLDVQAQKAIALYQALTSDGGARPETWTPPRGLLEPRSRSACNDA